MSTTEVVDAKESQRGQALRSSPLARHGGCASCGLGTMPTDFGQEPSSVVRM